MSEQPTQEQWEEVLKWCGFIRLPVGKKHYHFERTIKVMDWQYPDGTFHPFLPDLDLNNLFEFAVPKLREAVRDYEAHRILSECIRLSFSIKDKLDDRIVKAIWEVI